MKQNVIARVVISIFFGFLAGCGPEDGDQGPFHLITSADTTAATIGDVITIRVTGQGMGDKSLRFSKWEPDQEAVEVRSTALQHGEMGIEGIEFQVVFWDTGHYSLPDTRVDVTDSLGTVEFSMEAEPVSITVFSSIEAGDSLVIKPAKEPVAVGLFWPRRSLILTGLLLALVVAGIMIWRKRLKAEETGIRPVIPQRPPEKAALEELERLAGWEADWKPFYVQLSHILREYVERSIYVKALEMTTEEIRLSRDLFPLEDRWMEEWTTVLARADQVKFARHIPDRETSFRDLEWSRSFVQDTAINWNSGAMEE